ncbi:hypothetical protein BDD12DRAFT_855214 [Trichophaea hybrida]|nr:hypothetical protein BDD12DRAFT_855214 [Trichophaea hybrida]
MEAARHRQSIPHKHPLLQFFTAIASKSLHPNLAVMYFKTSLLNIVFLASALVGAIPQPISGLHARIPELEHPTAHDGIEKRVNNPIDIQMWTSKDCGGSGKFFNNVKYSQWYHYSSGGHYQSLYVNTHGSTGMPPSIYLGTFNAITNQCDQIPNYYYGPPGCQHNVVPYSCFFVQTP